MNGKTESNKGAFGAASDHGYGYDSTDTEAVWGASRLLAGQVLASIPDDKKPDGFFGLTAGEVKKLHHDVKALSEREQNLWTVRDNLKTLDINQIAALMQIEAVRGRLRTGAHIIAERNQQNYDHGTATFERAERQRKIVENIKMMKDIGYTAEEIKSIYSHKKIWMTFTPHPTKDKNPLGEQLFRDQARYADKVEPEHRQEAMAHTIGKMLESQITPQVKDTYEIETDDGLDAQDKYNRGMVNYFEDLQGAFDTVYGQGKIDLLADDMFIDVAARKWHGGDADGKKIPATVLFNQRVQDSLRAIQCYTHMLEDAEKEKGPGHDRLAEPIAALRKIETALQKVADRGKILKEAGSTSPIFAQAQEEFVQAFMGIEYKGEKYDSGPKLTSEIIKDIRALADDPNVSGKIHSAAWRTAFLHKQNGLAMGRTEMRHNSQDYNFIFDNLYTYLKENHPGVIKEKPAKLGDLSASSQRVLLGRLMKEHGDKMEGWLSAANMPDPAKDSKKEIEKKEWATEILERFRMVRKCYNNSRMGTAIIAEADATSAVKQQVLADAFGLKNMVHIALNEDQDTIKKAAENLAEYTKVFGLKNLATRRMNGNGNGHDSPDLFYCIMDPQSDSQKGYGLFIKGRQRTTKENLIDLGLSIKQAVYDKIGTGASHSRGGFSPKAVMRLFINILGGRKDWQNDDKKILRQMASFVSTTVQGRDAGMRFGTTSQSYDMLAGMDNEMNAACMAIDQKIPMKIVAPEPVKYTPAMEAMLEHIRQNQCDRYDTVLRKETSKIEGRLDEKRLDLYMDEVSATTVAEHSNVGARPDSRQGKKNITEARAIGSNIAITNTETYFDGSYTLGFFLQELHAEYKAGKITSNDLRTFLKDEFYMRQVFPNAFASMARADYEHGFDQLTGGNGDRWTVGVTQQTMKSGYPSMKENLAFHTVLANDAIHATAYMEALLDMADRAPGKPGAFDLTHDQIVARVYDRNDKVRQLKFGEKTREYYPVIDQQQALVHENRLSRAVIHEVERRIRLSKTDPENPQALDPANPETKKLLHHISTAHRNKGPINMDNLLDQPGTAFGRDLQPVMEYVRGYVYNIENGGKPPLARPEHDAL